MVRVPAKLEPPVRSGPKLPPKRAGGECAAEGRGGPRARKAPRHVYPRTLSSRTVSAGPIVAPMDAFVGCAETRVPCGARLTIIAEARLRALRRDLPPGSASGKAILTSAVDAWTQRVGGCVALPLLFRELAADPIAVLAAAGLPGDALDRPHARIGYAAFGRLLAVAAERTRCDHVGLLAGRMLTLADLGALGARVRQCGTVGAALRAYVAQQGRDSEGALAFIVEGAVTTELGYAIYHPYVEGTDQIYDFALAAMANYLRELCGPTWMPSEVLLPHARRSPEAPYRALLRANPRFDAEIAVIRFPSRWMARPVVHDEATPPVRAGNPLDRDPAPDVVQQVFRALRRQLLEGRASGDHVAQALGMNRRTLNRRLKARGLTFQLILHELRFGVARQLLSTSHIGLYDLAANLGYAGTSPFARTFSRWSGTAPGRWRRSHGAQAVEGSPAE